jgi:hypothetical protein
VIAFTIGFVIGANFGALIMAVVAMARTEDET